MALIVQFPVKIKNKYVYRVKLETTRVDF